MMLPEVERLDSIKIKATIAPDEVGTALAVYQLSGSTARSYEIYFCEQPSQLGLLPLLDAAVTLCIRRHPRGRGDVTVKLRPCRPGQLNLQWSAFGRGAHQELRIRGAWANAGRVVAASLVYSPPYVVLRNALDAGHHDVRRLFSNRQRRYLAECANTDPVLDELRLLGPV